MPRRRRRTSKYPDSEQGVVQFLKDETTFNTEQKLLIHPDPKVSYVWLVLAPQEEEAAIVYLAGHEGMEEFGADIEEVSYEDAKREFIRTGGVWEEGKDLCHFCGRVLKPDEHQICKRCKLGRGRKEAVDPIEQVIDMVVEQLPPPDLETKIWRLIDGEYENIVASQMDKVGFYQYLRDSFPEVTRKMSDDIYDRAGF